MPVVAKLIFVIDIFGLPPAVPCQCKAFLCHGSRADSACSATVVLIVRYAAHQLACDVKEISQIYDVSGSLGFDGCENDVNS